MTGFDPNRHHRRSIRLQDYDYTKRGAYFITICVQKKAHLFGRIENHAFFPSPAGVMVDKVLQELPERYPHLEIDATVIMPNHFHAILILLPDSPFGENTAIRPNLSDVVQTFKSITTHRYTVGVKRAGWPPYEQRLWQRNYFERIIRDETELNVIRCYVHDNPLNWPQDPENPRCAQNPTLQNTG